MYTLKRIVKKSISFGIVFTTNFILISFLNTLIRILIVPTIFYVQVVESRSNDFAIIVIDLILFIMTLLVFFKLFVNIF